MQPSYQYQPVNIQRGFNKAPNFLNNKILDKSAPNITPNKPYTFVSNSPNQQSTAHLSQNKSSYIANNKQTVQQSSKTFLQKNNNIGSISNPALKFYHTPQGLKTEEKMERINRGEMSRSLVIEQSQLNEDPNNHQINKTIIDPPKFSPPRRAPRMSEGYQPLQNNFRENNSSSGVHVNQQSPLVNKQKQTSFMKIKKFQDTSNQKKINVPAFLHKNTNDMRRSSFELGKMSTIQKNSTISSLNNLSASKQRRKINASDFQKIKQLGNGKYGRVYLVKQKYTGFTCALKVIQKKLLVEEQITEQFIRQLKIQMYLNHPNIIKMYGYFDDEKNIYIILEVGTGGQLYHHLKKNTSLPEAKVAFLMKQICQAVNQIHSLRIIHRDIKPENIVLHDNIIKLCDFGWSVHQDNKLRTTFCGTPLYVCPQILRGKQYDEKIDIWSLGIMMYEMVVGENPFKITKQEELIKIVKDQIKIPSYAYVSTEARDFLDKCLQKNPQDRVTIRELMNHPFLKKYQQKDKKTFNL